MRTDAEALSVQPDELRRECTLPPGCGHSDKLRRVDRGALSALGVGEDLPQVDHAPFKALGHGTGAQARTGLSRGNRRLLGKVCSGNGRHGEAGITNDHSHFWDGVGAGELRGNAFVRRVVQQGLP